VLATLLRLRRRLFQLLLASLVRWERRGEERREERRGEERDGMQ
jgi:hypothetical protein